MRIFEKDIVESTQKIAKEKKNLKSWDVVLAKEQRQGYGRKGNFWYSPKGGLYFSIILPKLKIENLKLLTILGAFSVAQTLKEEFNLEPFIKLPNDIYLREKKVCGILTENIIGKEVKISVMGIGLNTNIDKFPEELKDKATSLKIELKKEVSNRKILEKIISRLRKLLHSFKTG
jgi:BirA family biotin operon repressor/biotin-[acetyl-CoA-carboxylase] ligase